MRRTKRRYIALQIETEEAPNKRELAKTIWDTISEIYGEYGASLTNLILIDYDIKRKVAIICTSLSTLRFVRAALASVTSIANKQVALHVFAVSGTLKALSAKIKESKMVIE